MCDPLVNVTDQLAKNVLHNWARTSLSLLLSYIFSLCLILHIHPNETIVNSLSHYLVDVRSTQGEEEAHQSLLVSRGYP